MRAGGLREIGGHARRIARAHGARQEMLVAARLDHLHEAHGNPLPMRHRIEDPQQALDGVDPDQHAVGDEPRVDLAADPGVIVRRRRWLNQVNSACAPAGPGPRVLPIERPRGATASRTLARHGGRRHERARQPLRQQDGRRVRLHVRDEDARLRRRDDPRERVWREPAQTRGVIAAVHGAAELRLPQLLVDRVDVAQLLPGGGHQRFPIDLHDLRCPIAATRRCRGSRLRSRTHGSGAAAARLHVMHRGVPGAVDRRRDDRIGVARGGGDLPRRVEDVRERGLERPARGLGPLRPAPRSRREARPPRRAPSRRLRSAAAGERESRMTHVDRPLCPPPAAARAAAAAARALRNRSASDVRNSHEQYTGSVIPDGARSPDSQAGWSVSSVSG